MKYQSQKVYREKNKKFNTNKGDILNTRGKIDLDLVDEDYHYTMDMDGFELTERVQDVLDTLDDREARIIKNYLGFVDEPMTFAQISVLENVSAGRISEVYKRSLRKLRHPIRTSCIREYLVIND
jgi:RNA polymerase sigma factor (sigma-70 family)|tara:strand:- start:97 stop:471 length:375 start_codon:yes stop_codon:yes gene_type:complete